MFAKIAILCAVVAVAYGGVVLASPPASTTLLANTHVIAAAPALTVAHAPVAAVRTIAAGPAVAVAHAPTVYAAAPTVIATGNKIVHTVEPVEQHGYRIAY